MDFLKKDDELVTGGFYSYLGHSIDFAQDRPGRVINRFTGWKPVLQQLINNGGGFFNFFDDLGDIVGIGDAAVETFSEQGGCLGFT